VVFTDKKGSKMRVKRTGSQFIIYHAQQLASITYEVKQSFGDKKFWDNMIPCGGTVFSKEDFLINYQLITGYFKGYEQLPIRVTIKHPPHLYGSTAQQLTNRQIGEDHFYVDNYAALIDQPIIYHQPDTASFQVADTRFYIAVHNAKNRHSADSIKPQLQKIMDSLFLFMGRFSMKEYHFLFYLFDGQKVGKLTKAGLNAALEHRNSYMLTSYEITHFSVMIPFLNYITAHEFLHTWAPLHIHSNKTEPYPFNQPENLSAHLWLHEGVTDYLAAQFCEEYGFPTNNSMSGHIRFASKGKKRSFSASSRHIAESNMFNFLSKVMQIGKAYSRGQVIGLCLDVALLKRSNGELSLHDVMVKLSHDYYYGKPFEEDQLFKIIAAYSYPEMETLLKQYIDGKELPPYQEALHAMGKRYIARGERISSYGKFQLEYDKRTRNIYVAKYGKNTLGLHAGDSIIAVQYAKVYRQLYWPQATDTMFVEVIRNGTPVMLSGRPIYSARNKYTTIAEGKLTEEQATFKKWYWRKRKGIRQ
jgi:predicted metalloprotease with PDZ domain